MVTTSHDLHYTYVGEHTTFAQVLAVTPLVCHCLATKIGCKQIASYGMAGTQTKN